MPGRLSLRCSFMGSAGLPMMRNLETTAKLQTATMELAPTGPTTHTRYVCKVRLNYVSSGDLRCWPETYSSKEHSLLFFEITSFICEKLALESNLQSKTLWWAFFCRC